MLCLRAAACMVIRQPSARRIFQIEFSQGVRTPTPNPGSTMMILMGNDVCFSAVFP